MLPPCTRSRIVRSDRPALARALFAAIFVCWIPTSSAATGSTPYGGTPRALPGVVEAEDFDEGGAGVAYHDNTPGNAGGAYRNTDVDIAAAADVGGGYTLGWVSAGEWLNYTVQVGAAGTYDIEVRVASAGAGGTFRIEVNGSDLTGPLTVPNTGGWQNWVTIRRAGVPLGAGLQVWRLVMTGNGVTNAVGNFNWVRVTAAPITAGSTPYGGTPRRCRGWSRRRTSTRAGRASPTTTTRRGMRAGRTGPRTSTSRRPPTSAVGTRSAG
jgi:hypothetical protein